VVKVSFVLGILFVLYLIELHSCIILYQFLELVSGDPV